ncbi:MAG: flagellin FliC, partial [Proteobacteria bacterium]
SGAFSALSIIEQAINRVSTELGTLGVGESRLNAMAGVLSAMRDSNNAAAARILDVDVAAESADLVASQIRQQAAAAVLGNANIQPQLALILLKN